ncbi:hypothetical protein DICPUDRAFT_160384 [Dictyostelium purpureum]|uniref:DNA endonuclease activator Ctp1 C-terminal domain-containing protein n=1 Tax=Dictyostelium purpureum TaxID=5786 RepID=F1A689_DICPU|nr:uncharacterized protein DICPUDRAFT_160384 [Dictyostelium purpureum]EGC28291.1 hypothetical protein DICPUDRAFT_160384 [Dictyostelium purpureum]|eukprot:XP_003295184.1 hypothetical protein DICPUDRAFT_160384 [Dictyostelium purpureum]
MYNNNSNNSNNNNNNNKNNNNIPSESKQQLICSEKFQNAIKDLIQIHSNDFLAIEEEFQTQKTKWNDEKKQLLEIIEKLKVKNKELKLILMQQHQLGNISMDSIINSSFGSNSDNLTPIRGNGMNLNTSPGVFNKDSHRYNSDRIFDDFLSPSTPASKSASTSPISAIKKNNNNNKTEKSPKDTKNTTNTSTSTPTNNTSKKRKKKDTVEEEKELDELDLPNEQPLQYDNNNNENNNENDNDNDDFDIFKPNNSQNNNIIIDLDNEENNNINKPSSQSTIINNLSKQRNTNKKIKIKEVIRNQEEREKLQGFDCAHCKEFYDAVLGDDESKKKQMLNQCSRHRHNDEPPSTPPGFWDFEFK